MENHYQLICVPGCDAGDMILRVGNVFHTLARFKTLRRIDAMTEALGPYIKALNEIYQAQEIARFYAALAGLNRELVA